MATADGERGGFGGGKDDFGGLDRGGFEGCDRGGIAGTGRGDFGGRGEVTLEEGREAILEALERRFRRPREGRAPRRLRRFG